MFKNIYESFVLKYPLRILFITVFAIILLGTNVRHLEIDASSDTLLLENDKDLQYSRLINKRYQNQDFLLIAFEIKDDLLSNKNLNTIKQLSQELEKLPLVDGITSILNVPLLYSSSKSLQDLVNEIPTLQTHNNLDKKLVKNELLTSPLYKNALVSADFETTSILVHLKFDQKFFDLIEAKEELEYKEKNEILTPNEKAELEKILLEYRQYRDLQRQKEHENIKKIRQIVEKYENDSTKLFLGGVTMIVDDIISYIKSDLVIYGGALFAILILILWFIFKELKWILTCVVICSLSVLAAIGVLGLFGWQVTVISSNFISLQLIITLSIILHLIVQYKEFNVKLPQASQRELVLKTVTAKYQPSFFAIITTIAGFSSLVVSNIKPVINLGLMMSMSILLSLIIVFIVFPTILMLFKKSPNNPLSDKHIFSITNLCSYAVINNGTKIVLISVFVFTLSIWASSKLIVENSFINYFKKSTPIYQGMEVIDQKLGGTTPLDIIIDFKDVKNIDKNQESNDEFLDSFEDEFAQDEDSPEYWFTSNKMEVITKVHNYLLSLEEIGSVQSLATLLEVGKKLNDNKELDSILLALVYNQLPNEYKKIILSPYIDIENNQARITTRVIDSSDELRRDEFLKKIRMDLTILLKDDDVNFQTTGLMVLYNNMLQSLFDSQIATLGVVLLILFIMFIILFKSIKIALIALVVNIIPVSAIFGIMGILNIPLDIMTITIAAITIGIGVDDTIHYLHRFKEEYYKCGNYVHAMQKSHESIGYAMYYTSLTIILGFGILILSNFIPTIYFGLLTVVVMFIVLLADLLLLPRLLIIFKPFK